MLTESVTPSPPSPAIVSRQAVRRLPRLALWSLCVVYVVAGFVGRAPWKRADISAFGFMRALAEPGTSLADWLAPRLLDLTPNTPALLPYWMGALAIRLAPAGVPVDVAARLPFMGLLALTLLATWYAVFHLARHPAAQPVAFAFGGEASGGDYGRALADGSLLALIATLGLAQFSHEATPSLVQLAGVAVLFYGLAAVPLKPRWATLCAALGLWMLFLSGAPLLALVLGSVGGVVQHLPAARSVDGDASRRPWFVSLGLLGATALGGWLAWRTDQWQGPALAWPSSLAQVKALASLWLWFTWPVAPFALWTLWRWRRQLRQIVHHRHLALPLLLAALPAAATLWAPTGDRVLLLALPGLAALAALALPTLGRNLSALVDWFTLLFFSACALGLWVMWMAMQTGVPAKPAANIAKLAPGFVPALDLASTALALLATGAWLWLVRWRTGRHRPAIWKSLVLPAGGTALCWLLLSTLGMPVFDYARSYVPQMAALRAQLGPAPGCVLVSGLDAGRITALQFHAGLTLRRSDATGAGDCRWLIVSDDHPGSPSPVAVDANRWHLHARVQRPTDRDDNLLLYARRAP